MLGVGEQPGQAGSGAPRLPAPWLPALAEWLFWALCKRRQGWARVRDGARFVCVLRGRGSSPCLGGTGTVAAQGCPGHPRREVGSVPQGLGAHTDPLGGWQGTLPGCWHRALPVPTFTKASRTASSSWGKTWPRTRRQTASSCRGCTESVGEYGPMPGPPAYPTPLGPVPGGGRVGGVLCGAWLVWLFGIAPVPGAAV